jgi:predicted nucleic acid-binding protein
VSQRARQAPNPVEARRCLLLINRKDGGHVACLGVMEADAGPYYLPSGILSEIGWFLEERYRHLQADFLADLAEGVYTVDWEPLDLDRLSALILNYSRLPLSIADAVVIMSAERHGGQVLTLDEHFSIVGRDPDIEISVRP